MSDERPAGSISAVVKTITDIGASVAALIAYLVAVFGLGDIPFPKTTSLITVLATSMVIIGWRWREISRRKPRQSKRTTRERRNPGTAASSSWRAHLLEPLADSKTDEFQLSLNRRRLEAGVLFSIGLFSVGWSAWSMSAVVQEFASQRALVCSNTESSDRLMVMVAELNQTNGLDLQFGARIYDALLENQPEGLYDVCRLKEPIEDRTQARRKLQEYQADVLIWGRSAAIYEVYLEAPALDLPHREISEISSAEAASFEFQLKEPPQARFFAQFALGELFLLNKQVRQAQETLEEMLAITSANAVPKEHLAQAYFFLGLLYDPEFFPFRIDSGVPLYPDDHRALDAYSHAIELDPTLHAARLNRGLIYRGLQMFDNAIADFTFLIENDSRYKVNAYIHRASVEFDPVAAITDLEAVIQMDPANGYYYLGLEFLYQEEYLEAVEAFEKALQYGPDEYSNYHGLGQAQVLAGDVQAARQTYERMLPYADRNDIEQVIADLRDDAEWEPSAQADIEDLIRQLQAANVP